MDHAGETDLAILLATLQPELSREEFVILHFDGGWQQVGELAPWAVISEEEGLTVIIERERAAASGLGSEALFRRITLQVHSSLEAVGLTAAVAGQLSRYGISANVVAGCYHDHIFVPAPRGEEALAALEKLASGGILRRLV